LNEGGKEKRGQGEGVAALQRWRRRTVAVLGENGGEWVVERGGGSRRRRNGWGKKNMTGRPELAEREREKK
jgi:hypothetical protein